MIILDLSVDRAKIDRKLKVKEIVHRAVMPGAFRRATASPRGIDDGFVQQRPWYTGARRRLRDARLRSACGG